MVLLVGAGLMMRGFLREQRNLPGFDTTRLLTADILLGGHEILRQDAAGHEPRHAAGRTFYDQLLERVRAMPGVTRAGIISRLPFDVVDASVHHRRPAGAGTRARSPPPISTRSTRRRSTRSGSGCCADA